MPAMRRAERLYELQKIDLALDAARKRVSAIDALLSEGETMRSARQAANRIRDRIAQLRTRLKDLELQSTTLDDRIALLDQRLYSGAIKNPKELGDLQRDLDSLRRRKLEMDEMLLSVMADVEEAERDYEGAHAELTRVEAAWRTDQSALTIERAHLTEQIEALDQERSAQRAETSPPDLAVYDRLRAQRHGQAVARLDDGMCGACGVQPSANKLSHLRRDDTLITCGNCERVLVDSA